MQNMLVVGVDFGAFGLSQDTSIQTGVLQALDTWLGEDLARVEGKLIQKDAVASLVDLYARSHQSQETQV